MPDDPRRDVSATIPQHSRMNDEYLQKRSDAFRRGTQRKGMPMQYGKGEAGSGAKLVEQVRKREAREAMKAAAE